MLIELVLLAVASFLSPPQAPATGQTLVRGVLVDADYAFELREPGPDWELLGEDEVSQRFVSGALAGAVRADGLFGVISARPIAKLELDEVRQWATQVLPIADRTVTKSEAVQWCGQPAWRVLGLGDFGAERVRFRALMTVHKGFLVTSLAAGPLARISLATTELEEFEQALALQRKQPKPRPFDAAENETLEGSGWVASGDELKDAAFGLVVRAPKGWRLHSPADAGLRGDSAIAALQSRGPDVWIEIYRERVPKDAQAALAKAIQLPWALVAEDPKKGARPTQLQLLGKPAQLDWYSTGGAPFYLQGVVHAWRDDVLLSVRVECLRGELDKAVKAVQSALAGVSQLPPEERASFALDRLIASDDGATRLSSFGSVRDGTYWDQRGQFEWSLPAGFWDCQLYRDRDVVDASLRLVLSDSGRGVGGLLLVVDDALVESLGRPRVRRATGETQAEAFARALRDRYLDSLTSDEELAEGAKEPKVISSPPVRAGEITLELATREWRENGLDRRVVLATVGRVDCAVLFAFTGLASNVEATTATLRRSLESFRWKLGGAPLRGSRPGWYFDDVLGLSVRLPGPQWRIETFIESAQKRIAVEGRDWSARLTDSMSSLYISELTSRTIRPSRSSMATLAKLIVGDAFGGIDWAQPQIIEAGLAGRPGRIYRFDGPTGRVEIDLVAVRGLVFAFVFTREGASVAGPDEFAELKRGFVFSERGQSCEQAIAAATAPESAPSSGADPAPAGAPGSGAESQPAEPTSGAPGAADADAHAAPAAEPAAAGAKPRDARAQPALALPEPWIELPPREAPTAFDLRPAFRARPDPWVWLREQKLVEAAAAASAEQLAIAPSAVAGKGAELFSIERSALRAPAASVPAKLAGLGDWLQKQGAREFALEPLGEPGAQRLWRLRWLDPVAKSTSASERTNLVYLALNEQHLAGVTLRLDSAAEPRLAELERRVLAWARAR